MQLEHASASRFQTFDQCQLKYHAIYDLGIKEKPEQVHPTTIMGKAGHKMMEVSTNARRLDLHPRIQDPMALIDAACAKYSVKADQRPILRKLIGNAVAWGYFRNIDHTVGCEVSFFEEIAPGLTIKGFIDRLDIQDDGRADIVDLKFGRWQPKEFDGWQARMYNVALSYG